MSSYNLQRLQTHVKRASKAAIVNKSIEFIRDIHKAENRLVKENDALKAELEALRQRVNASQPSGQAGNNGAAASALGLANVNAAHAAAAAAAAGMPQHMQQHHLFPGMHPMQMQMPMMPHLPAAMATVAAAAAAHNNGNPTLGSAIHQSLPPAPKAENAHNHAQQQQQQSAPPSAGLPAQSNAELGQHLFPGIFTGLFNAGGAFDNMEHSRSESGSPTGSSISQSQQQQHQPGSRNGGSGQFAHGLFELPAMSGFATEGGNKVGGSPASYNSPPGTVASLAGSERTSQSQQSNSQLTSNTAPSPASSHSVPTPVNSYSPINLPGLTATPQSAHSLASQAQGMTDPAIAAFDGSADAAYLAAQFAPNDLAKAQHELHAFIAYQQRMAYAGQSGAQQQQQQPSPTNGNGQMSPTLFPPHGSFSYQQQQQQQMMPFGGVCGPNSQTGMPAWQMMMAQQQQAMVAAYGQQGHF